MKLTSVTGIYCPHCKKELEYTVGFFGTFFMPDVIKRIKKDGATITCGHCNKEFDYKEN